MAYYLVTGGAGFVGSHLVRHLLRRGHRVRVLDDLSTGCRANIPASVEFFEGDVTDPATVRPALNEVDGCFHLAAIASVVQCHREWLRSHQANLTGTINVFDQARSARADAALPVVYASTAAVYGDRTAARVSEAYPVAPLSAYAADKAACEFHARVAGAVHGVPTIGLRFFNLYGPGQDPCSPYSGVISKFAEQLLRREALEIFGDGEQVRDFVYVGDAVVALDRAMANASRAAPVYNICTGVGTTVRQLACTLARLCEARLTIRYFPRRHGDIGISIGDPARAHEELDFRAGTALEDGLKTLLAGMRTSPREAVPSLDR